MHFRVDREVLTMSGEKLVTGRDREQTLHSNSRLTLHLSQYTVFLFAFGGGGTVLQLLQPGVAHVGYWHFWHVSFLALSMPWLPTSVNKSFSTMGLYFRHNTISLQLWHLCEPFSFEELFSRATQRMHFISSPWSAFRSSVASNAEMSHSRLHSSPAQYTLSVALWWP